MIPAFRLLSLRSVRTDEAFLNGVLILTMEFLYFVFPFVADLLRQTVNAGVEVERKDTISFHRKHSLRSFSDKWSLLKIRLCP